MFARALFFIAVFISSFCFVSAQAPPSSTGCYIQCTGCTNVFYTNNTRVERNSGTSTAGFIYNTALALNTSSICPKVGTYIGTSVSKRCYGPSVGQSGVEYTNYTVNYCPLDGYLLFMILPLTGIGFYLLRKRSLESVTSEPTFN